MYIYLIICIEKLLQSESLFINPKQCSYKPKQLINIVIALVVNKQNGGQVC